MKKLVTTRCPCCKATLEFNRENGRIERHWAAGEKQEARDLFDVADEAARKAAEDVDMGALTRKSREKSEGLDDVFKRAAEKAKEAFDRGEKPENPFDLD